MAQVDNEIVGASTGLPLSDETAEFQGAVLSAGWDITRIFYFGESVLLPEYRSQGIGHEFLIIASAMPPHLVVLPIQRLPLWIAL